jgi:hypothetical protein
MTVFTTRANDSSDGGVRAQQPLAEVRARHQRGEVDLLVGGRLSIPCIPPISDPAQRVAHAGPSHSTWEGGQQGSGVCNPMQFIAGSAV